MRVEDMRRLERAKMSKWMCGVNLRNGKSSEEITNKLVGMSDLMCHGRLGWFGHVKRKDADD
jgi:hypothetical protein